MIYSDGILRRFTMSELGALSQHALNIQNMQMAIIKNQVQMQQKVVEVLLESTQEMVQASETLGTKLDISV